MIRAPGTIRSGFTLLELAIVVTLLTVLLAGVAGAVLDIQGAYLENQTLSILTLRVEHAIERIVAIASQAVTIDSSFTPLKPGTGIDSHCLQFRLIDSFAAGQPVYDDDLVVYIYGPDSGSSPSRGIIIGRGSSLVAVHTVGRGPDGLLGTLDDDTNTSLFGGVPAVELLLPSIYAPSQGDMLRIDVNGLLLTFTFRLNAIGSDGGFILPNDLVVTERVALRN